MFFASACTAGPGKTGDASFNSFDIVMVYIINQNFVHQQFIIIPDRIRPDFMPNLLAEKKSS